jgi:hypothetical protein
MDCIACGQHLSGDDIAMHDCSSDAAPDCDAVERRARSLYQRLLAQPSVSLAGAYGSTVTEGHAKDDMLRRALSIFVDGPPLPLTRQEVLTREHVQLFVATATEALNRVKDLDRDDFLHYCEPPLQYRLLVAVLRQATRAEHVVALLTALSVASATPHLLLEESRWRRHDDDICSDVDFSPNPQVLKVLEAELRNIVLDDRYASDDSLTASRSFLWKDRDEFIVTVLHVMLLSLMGDDSATALPSLSESDAGSWLPRLTELVAVALGPSGTDAMTLTRSAVDLINANPLASFTTTRLARAFPVALSMVMVDCVLCGLTVPRDCCVRCGKRVLCKLCYEASAIEFAESPGDDDGRKDHKLTIEMYRKVVSDEVAEKVSRSIAAFEEHVKFDGRFHCPLNADHQTPFHAPMPEHPSIHGAPVGITCTECKSRWCAQCKCADHPHAATCGEVTNVKLQWSTYADNMKRCANIVFSELDSEMAAVKLAVTDRAAAVERRSALLQRQISRINVDIADIKNAITIIQKSNHDEARWDGDGGYPKVIGSRRCPYCGRQPIKRMRNCYLMNCGQDSHTGANFQGGCSREFDYTSPAAAYQPISTAPQESELAKLQAMVDRLSAQLSTVGTQDFPVPALANHWPTLSCSSCNGGLLGNFHVQCYHCTPPYLLCLQCVRNNKHNEHNTPGAAGHVFATRNA